MDRRMAAGKTCFLMRAKQAEGPMKKWKTALVLILLSVVFIDSPALAAEFTDNSANINNTFLPAKIGFSFLKTGYGDRSFQYEYGNIFAPPVERSCKVFRLSSSHRIVPLQILTSSLYFLTTTLHMSTSKL